MAEQIEEVVLHEATEERYLNYALSVITSRALPDVRDGLKPVQRRILYAMHRDLRLTPEARHRKSAAVVGEVMGKYHPHGDQSIYDAMVRMAQDFSLRYPLVDGQGNFGSLDGDRAAAMRYTEAKLRHLAIELLSEIKKKTVDYRPNYDGTHFEPVVLPAQLPNLLLNGAQGIAVGMATNIPPHNLREVTKGLVALIDNPELTTSQLVRKFIKAPDFPTGGEILNSTDELVAMYEKGSGAVDVRGTWELEEEGKTRLIVINSLPWGLNKASLVSDIADHIRGGKLPQLVDVRDESTEEIRVVLELAKKASADTTMAYLYKKTALQSRFNLNMTVLCPTENPEVCRPEKLSLKAVLRHFLDFRMEVTTRRLNFDLAELERRIHLLKAFAIIFDALDEAIRLIRSADGKADAREKLMERFELDYEQAEAILETKLYRLAKLEIDAIRAELAEKEAKAAELRALLGSETNMWSLIKDEIENLRDAYKDYRRTKLVGPQDEVEFSESDYIVAEDAFVIVTRDGWMKRQRSYSDIGAIRVREGDQVQWVVPCSSKETLILFTDRGRAYTLLSDSITMTTGYGEPIQSRFDFVDGERLVGASTSDGRTQPIIPEGVLDRVPTDAPIPPYVVMVTRAGRCSRMALSAFAEPSSVKGRVCMRLDSKFENDGLVRAEVSDGREVVSLVSRSGRCLLFPVDDVKVLGSAGRGVFAIKLGSKDFVLGWTLARGRMEGVQVKTNRGREEVVRWNRYSVTARGGRGREIIRSGYISEVDWPATEYRFHEGEVQTSNELDNLNEKIREDRQPQRSLFKK